VVLAIGAFHFYGRVPTGGDGNTDVAMTPDKPSASRSNEAGVPAAGEVLGQATAADVDEPALVAPTPIPDRSVTFGQPILTSHFVAAAPEAAAGGAVDATAATGSIAATPAALTIALPAPPADAGLPAPDPRIGSPKLIDAAMTGDPGAAFEVASRYAQGDRLPKNLAKAAEWYQRAAEGGVVVAQYRLASLYERGQGVAKDLAEAVNWYQHAADQGNVNAMHNLAVLMSEGVDGPPDQAKALQWFQTAAGYGVRDSQYNLGVIYARGLGVDQDLVASYKWFALAAAQGDDDAAQRRDEVADALSADDLAKARAAAAAWHAKPSLAEANAVVMPAGGWDDPGDGLAEADRQALVKKIQTLLAEQGYDPGPVDGVAGPRTLQAVRQFQHKVGEPETGQIDTGLVALLTDGQS